MSEMQALAEELREYTAMKYAGDCKCGKCQLVPRALVERIYHTLNGSSVRCSAVSDEIASLRSRLAMAEGCAALAGINVDVHAVDIATLKSTMAKLIAAEKEIKRLRAEPQTAPSDIERAFQDACDEAGCAYDNEALLEAIHALKERCQAVSAK